MSSNRPRRPALALGCLGLLVLLVSVRCACSSAPLALPTPTAEPLVPTPTPAGAGEPATAAAKTTVTPLRASPGPTAVPMTPALSLEDTRGRFGVGVALGSIADYPVEAAGLGIGWYLDWNVRPDPPRPAGADFWQMVRVYEGGYRPDRATIRRAAAANPGSFWIIGNEPDVRWQDNTTPERYAQLYQELHSVLKAVDPTSRVAIAGVSQPTPLRLAYLERVLAAYQERYGKRMPVDVWNVHGFILREERDSWGVGIPPGIEADAGVLREIDDHDDLDIFRDQILDFRRWMAEQGEGDKPLVVSEYGILMPEDYGFGPERVGAFMEGTFDVFLTAADDRVGYARDDHRLVQWWCWYSLAAPESYYPTGNLFDPETKELTALGRAFATYVAP